MRRVHVCRLHVERDSREVVRDQQQIVSAPADDLDNGEVGLPQLIEAPGWLREALVSPHHFGGRVLDQVIVGVFTAVNNLLPLRSSARAEGLSGF